MDNIYSADCLTFRVEWLKLHEDCSSEMLFQLGQTGSLLIHLLWQVQNMQKNTIYHNNPISNMLDFSGVLSPVICDNL